MTQLDLYDDAEPSSSSAPASTQPAPPAKRRQGFAVMDRARVQEIARKGGIAAHACGRAHRFTADEARVAGKKGGTAPHVRRGRARSSQSP
jgi:general stress protein YciG